MATEAELVTGVLNRHRSALGTGEIPPGSNSNFIVDWYNANVEAIGNGPWCEMTNTWAMWTSGAQTLKSGRAYTVWAAQDAEEGINGSFWHWGTDGMRAGDQVYYDWGQAKGNVAYVDHTGTVEKINGDGSFYVLEGNISDKLQRMLRDGKYVVGYARFDWAHLATAPSPSPAPSPTPQPAPEPAPAPASLSVDGELGPATITRWQQIMGTPVDGVISTPSDLVRAVQNKLQGTVNHRLVVDGVGIYQDNHPYQTVGALQSYLKSPVDLVMSSPVSTVVKALQRRLNEGWF